MAMDIAALYAAHRTALVQMLTTVVGDVETAEDVCQDVFVFALSGDNDPSRGDDPVLWLYYTARLLARQTLYHRQRSRQALLSACQLVDDPTDRALEHSQEAAVLHGLPEPWRAALILRVLGFSWADAAFVLRCTADNVRVYLFSARRMLQTYAPVVSGVVDLRLLSRAALRRRKAGSMMVHAISRRQSCRTRAAPDIGPSAPV